MFSTRIILIIFVPLLVFFIMIRSFLLKEPRARVDNLPIHPIALSHQVLIDPFNPLNTTSTSVAFLCQSSSSTVIERIARISGVPFVLTNDLNTFNGKFAYLDVGSLTSTWFTTEHVLMLKQFTNRGGHLLIARMSPFLH